jgi:hypothetical protein
VADDRLSYRFVHMAHSGGIKFCELAYVSKPGTTIGLCVRRYGAVGASGKVVVERDDNGLIFNKLLLEKSSRGYGISLDQSDRDRLESLAGNSLFVMAAPRIREEFSLGQVAAVSGESLLRPATPATKPELNRSKDPLWGTW